MELITERERNLAISESEHKWLAVHRPHSQGSCSPPSYSGTLRLCCSQPVEIQRLSPDSSQPEYATVPVRRLAEYETRFVMDNEANGSDFQSPGK